MKHTITVASSAREELIDITLEVKACVKSCGIRDGLVALYVQGATAAIIIQENWDASVRCHPSPAKTHSQGSLAA